MNLVSEDAQHINKSKTTFKESLKWGAILFIAVAIIGFGIAYAFKYLTDVGEYATSKSRFSTDAVSGVRNNTGLARTLGVLSITSMVFILASSVLNFLFMWRVSTISKPMTIITLLFFVVSNGIGFGVLFLSFNAIELVSIFAIAGGIFALIAIGTTYVKSMNWAMPIMIVGGIAAMVMSLVSIILYATGVYSDKLILITNILSSFLTIIWTMFDFWRIRQFTQYQEWDAMSDRDKFVYPKFFGFRLASDLIAIIWRLAYFVARSQR